MLAITLDAWDALFIWIGQSSNGEERKATLEAAQRYLETDPSGRDVDTPIIVVKQFCEPINFTGFFGAWNPDLWQVSDTSPGVTTAKR